MNFDKTKGIEFQISTVVSRNGCKEIFRPDRITADMRKAFMICGEERSEDCLMELTSNVDKQLASLNLKEPYVEQIQDAIEQTLLESGHLRAAKAYVIDRAEKTRAREHARLMRTFDDISQKAASESELKRDNANVDGDTAMGTMLQYGSEGVKRYHEMFVLNPKHAEAHREGDIHIHDLDFLTMTTTCCQIDLLKLFMNGFATGHGSLREPNDIRSYEISIDELLEIVAKSEKPDWQELLCQTDILVDGPFIQEQATHEVPFCGSSNQRILHLHRSRFCHDSAVAFLR